MFYSLLGLLLALIFSRHLATAALALAAAVIAVRTRIGDREDETHRDAAPKGDCACRLRCSSHSSPYWACPRTTTEGEARALA